MTPRVLRGALVALLFAGFFGGPASARTAAAYLAADGFGAPELVVQVPAQTAAAIALDQGTPVVYWYDPAGVHRVALTGTPDRQQVHAGRGLRGVAAVTVGHDPAVLRVVRDFQTGRNAHVLTWRGEERMVADALEVLPVALASTSEGPSWLVHGRVSGRGRLVLDGWSREPTLLRVTDMSLAGYDLTVERNGTIWVAWLEGTSERSAFGVVSNWTTYLARVDAAGDMGPAFAVGKALRRSDIDRVRVAVDPAGDVQVLWPREDGVLVGTSFDIAELGDPLADAVRSDVVLGSGVTLALAGGAAYWAEADRVMERSLEPGSGSRAVLWAPHAIQAGDAVTGAEGDLFLTWYGGALSGSYAVYAAGTADPFEPTWLDRVAAAMAWNPWNLWSEALGQALASLLAAVLVTMALSPFLWLGSALAVRYGSIHDGTWVGIGIGSAVVLLGVGIVRLRLALPPDVVDALFGVWWHMALALAVAVGLTWVLRRRRDTEPLIGTLLAAASCTGFATLVLAFATYQSWATSWTGFL